MKKYIFGIIIVVAIIIIGCKRPSPSIWVNNVVSAGFSDGTINEKIGKTPSCAEIYIDASGSMKPYFNSNEADMVNTVSEILNLNTSHTDIYFLNNPIKYNGLICDILGDIKKQPNLSTTSFHQFFEEAVNKIDTTDCIIYLVTDGIMSVNGNMSKALVELRGKIKESLSGHENIAGAILRYIGEYNGSYWDYKNIRHDGLSMKRPYYIIALGKKESIRWLQTKSDDILNHPEDKFFIGVHDFNGHMKANLALGDNTAIENMNKSVQLILDLPTCLYDINEKEVVLTNLGNKLPIEVKKNGYRLEATIDINQPVAPDSDGRIRIRLTAPYNMPTSWVNKWNSEDDLNGPDETTTYGLGTLVRGIFDGLEPETNLIETEFVYKLK